MSSILIVEDDTNIRKFISVNLTARGYDVIEAEDGQEGLARLRTDLPAMLLLDIKLPDLSGWEVLQIMTDDPAYQAVPVIIITASLVNIHPNYAIYNNKNLRRILKKPISIQELTNEVKEVLR
jgi:DNA-binding response OmpR family regulator